MRTVILSSVLLLVFSAGHEMKFGINHIGFLVRDQKKDSSSPRAPLRTNSTVRPMIMDPPGPSTASIPARST